MNELATVVVVLTVVIAALLALAPAISTALVQSRGRGLPPSLALRLSEEWAGELEAIPNRATKLAFAIGIRLTRRKAFAGLAGDAMATPGMTPRRSLFSFFGGWKTIIAAPTVLLAIAGYAASFSIRPLYRAETTILAVPQRVPGDVVKPTTPVTGLDDRLRRLSQQILSRTRLERIINDFSLYPDQRRTGVMEDVIERMRKDVEFTIVHGDAVRVGYVGTDPRTTMRVTERLASLVIDENLRDRVQVTAGTHQFLDDQIDDARRRLIELAKTLTRYRLSGNDALLEDTAVTQLEYDAMGTIFKDLLTKREEAKMAANLERRQIGEQFKVLDPARLPERPFTPNRQFMMLVGAIAGLCLGLAMMLSGLGRRSARPRQAVRVGDTGGLHS